MPSRDDKPRPAPLTRLTVVSSVYYVYPNGQPVHCKANYSRQLSSEEQPYVRVLNLTEEWITLDTGWVKSASMLVVTNDNKKPHDPTVELVVGIGTWLIPPRGHMQGQPADLSLNPVKLRARGKAKCTVHVFPS